MDEMINESRRVFLRASAAVGGGLLIGFYLPGAARFAQAAPAPAVTFTPNAWIRIGADNIVTVMVGQSEMGQGIMTGLPMIVAEELEADWDKVRVESPLANLAYARPDNKVQGTGGSASVRRLWQPLRQAGAAGRQMLVTAAAQTWGVDESTCVAQRGEVIHKRSGRRLQYGALAEKAATLPVPKEVALKDPKDFRILGKAPPRVDTPQKVNGSAIYGIDIKVPGMLVATVARCPVFGGKVASFNAEKIKAVKGVRNVVQINSGIAVVADNFWAAKKGRDALEISWDEGANAKLSSASLSKTYAELAQKPGAVARSEGDADKALASAAKKIHAVYEVPFLAHATMEPMNCTAHVTEDGCEIWAPTQGQTRAQRAAAKITGFPAESIKLHTTLLGGGFGRRLESDFVEEAVQISMLIGAPVKVIWTREDDMQHDFYRPATYSVFDGGLDKKGTPIAWKHRVVSPSIRIRTAPETIKNGLDEHAMGGAMTLPDDIPNMYIDYVMHNTIPVGVWRSVSDSQNGFVTQGFLDELAVAAGRDPYEFRRKLLSKAPRHKGVLELAATKAGWGKPLPKGVYRGIAVHHSYASWAAQVAEVSVAKDGNVKVHRVVCAIDCGIVINPDTVRAQMESGIVYGLTAALGGEITLNNGRVQQRNFDDYPMLRMNEMPKIEVYIVSNQEAPGGIGEPGTPPIAPAVVNAIFAATGKRIRKLPIRAEDLRTA